MTLFVTVATETTSYYHCHNPSNSHMYRLHRLATRHQGYNRSLSQWQPQQQSVMKWMLPHSYVCNCKAYHKPSALHNCCSVAKFLPHTCQLLWIQLSLFQRTTCHPFTQPTTALDPPSHSGCSESSAMPGSGNDWQPTCANCCPHVTHHLMTHVLWADFWIPSI